MGQKDLRGKLLEDYENEGKPVRMCNVAQALEEKGIGKGIEKGKYITLYGLYKNKKLSLIDAAEEASMTADEFLAIAKEYTN